MNANDLLDIIGEAKGTYVMEAQRRRSGEKPQPRRLSLSRTVLIAAVIALSLLLVGCTVAYVLSLQDMKIAEATTTKRFNDEGRIIEPTEVTQDVISLHGYNGSPLQLATQEWYEFEQNYDPDGALAIANDDNPQNIPEDYLMAYGCYTQEMVDKVNEIAEKYDLKLLTKDTLVQRYQNDIFFEALGLESLCRADAQAEAKPGSGYFYRNGNFKFDVDFTLTGGDAAWDSEIWSTVYYAAKDYFDPDYSTIETDSYEQWAYTTSDGTPLLLAQNGLTAMVFAEQENAMITVTLNFNTDFGYPYDDRPIPDKAVIEQAAEVFDYSIRPQAVEDYDAVQAKLDAAEAEWQASQQVEAEVFTSFGDYLLNEFWIDDLYYALMDFDGDGAEELLLGPGDGSFNDVLNLRDGNVEVDMYTNLRLCGNGIVEGSEINEEYARIQYTYYKAADNELELIEGIECKDGVWERYASSILESETITEEEANAIRSKYPCLELEWKSALSYPVDESGETVGDILREWEVVLSQDDRRAIFAEYASTNRSIFTRKYYTFLDINGDGEEELLLGEDENSFNQIYMIRHGRARVFYEATSYLYEGNVIARFSDGIDYEQGWYKCYSYNKLEGTDWTNLEYLYYWQGTDSWTTKRNGPEITEDTANATMDKYVPAELNMRPLKELMDTYGIE